MDIRQLYIIARILVRGNNENHSAPMNAASIEELRELGLASDASWADISMARQAAHKEKARMEEIKKFHLDPNADWRDIRAAQNKADRAKAEKAFGLNPGASEKEFSEASRESLRKMEVQQRRLPPDAPWPDIVKACNEAAGIKCSPR
jgi:hypothetical protein